MDFKQIYIENYPKVVKFAKGFVMFEEEAENIAQDVFMELLKNREKISEIVNLQSYVFTLARNRCLDHLRHEKVRKGYADQVLEEGEVARSLNEKSLSLCGGLVYTQYEELRKAVEKAVESLPERCRQIFLLSRTEELKYSEIAERLSVSVNTVENQMSIALKKLRVSLADYMK